MTPDVVQAWSAVAGNLIAIVGFAFVVYQIRQMNQVSRGTAHATIFSHYLEITNFIAANPGTRPYLYEGKVLNAGDPNHDTVLIACEAFSDFYEHVALQRESLPHESLDCWDRAIARRVIGSPELQAYIEQNRRVYHRALIEAIDRGAELLGSPFRFKP